MEQWLRHNRKLCYSLLWALTLLWGVFFTIPGLRLWKNGMLRLWPVVAAFQPHPPASAKYYPQPVSYDQAVQLVRTFERNPGLPLRPIPHTHPLFEPLGIELTSGRDEYEVGRTGEHFLRANKLPGMGRGIVRPVPEKRQPRVRSRKQAEAIAVSFLQQHSWHKDISGWTLGLWDRPHQGFLRFLAIQGPGVLGPSECNIEVDRFTGNIVYCGMSYYPLLIDPVPKLTAREAMKRAMSAVLIRKGTPGRVTGLRVIRPRDQEEESLLYEVTCTGIGLDEGTADPGTYYVGVDGNTGEIIYRELTS